jgi:hypothetical protein
MRKDRNQKDRDSGSRFGIARPSGACAGDVLTAQTAQFVGPSGWSVSAAVTNVQSQTMHSQAGRITLIFIGGERDASYS